MKNSLKKQILGALMLVSSTALTGCFRNKDKGDNQLLFWSSFGQGYTEKLDEIVEEIKEEQHLDLKHADQGSYDKILSNMAGVIKSKLYPNIVVGYPDHFAGYAGSRILEPLDSYIEKYNQDHGTNILKESEGGYYESYLEENQKIDVDAKGNAVTSGVPFNKSTELLGYNGVFVDYCVYWCKQNPDVEVNGVKASNWNLGEIPATWQDWKIKGEYYRHILDVLIGLKTVSGWQDYTGKAYFGADVPSGKTTSVLLDLSEVKTRSETRVIGWDSTDNMFITLLRQWGGKYTKLPKDQYSKAANRRVGQILFTADTYHDEDEGKDYTPKQTAIDCIKYFAELNNKLIFGDASRFGSGGYCSKAFEANKVMFMVCSSGGLSYNTAEWRNRFSVAPLPYYYDAATNTTRKYVISQGANIALTKQSGDKQKAFEFIAALTTGEHQLDWCLSTGYYPACKGVAESQRYQDFLYADTIEAAKGTPEVAYQVDGKPSGLKVAYREGARVNKEQYMDATKGWVKFVDDAFVGSSTIRKEVKDIFPTVFGFSAEDAVNDTKIAGVLSGKATAAFNQNSNNIKIVS